jgi:DNA invertase Pin-like site-specific DNA recombinase
MNGEQVKARHKRYISYLRVSTKRQGRSGLGLEAQQQAVRQFLNGEYTLIAEYIETETGRGKDALDKRPVLREALAHAKRAKACLLIAKLDRLARNVHFISGLMETGVEFLACDLPTADRFMLHIYAAVAEQEGRAISERTRAALAAAKARGVKLGGPTIEKSRGAWHRETVQWLEELRIVVAPMVDKGMTQTAIAEALNRRGIAPRFGGKWTQAKVSKLLKRLGV